jgi:hypothetical protein
MEEMILEEVRQFTGFLREHTGQPIDMSSQFNLPILNALWRVTVGDRQKCSTQTSSKTLEEKNVLRILQIRPVTLVRDPEAGILNLKGLQNCTLHGFFLFPMRGSHWIKSNQ